MIQKKVCMLGAYAVGKTSLVARYVHSIFSDKYLTTVGVKIEKRTVDLGDRQVNLVIWDLYGDDAFQRLRMSYLRGSAGYLLVVDGTRRETLDTALGLDDTVEHEIGRVPRLLVLNKADLEPSWELDAGDLADLSARGWRVIRTSAKTGAGVDETFETLARLVVNT